MKIVCIYHSIDLDGWMSAAIVKHWYLVELKRTVDDILNRNNEDEMTAYRSGTLNFIGYNYGQPIPDLSNYDKVILVDISFPVEDMFTLAKRLGADFVWIDHHQPKIEELDNYFDSNNGEDFDGLLTCEDGEKFAACELSWMYFFPNEPMPEIVRLLGRYDCFGHKGTDEELKVLEFQYGARQCISNYEEAYDWLIGNITARADKEKITGQLEYNDFCQIEHLEPIFDAGKAIYQYLCTEAKQAYKNGFEITFEIGGIGVGVISDEKFKFICINKERFNPVNFGIDYHKDGYDGCMCFHYDGVAKLWRFSLYNDNGLVDCSTIAKQFGGGGHKGAAGFTINNITKVINHV